MAGVVAEQSLDSSRKGVVQLQVGGRILAVEQQNGGRVVSGIWYLSSKMLVEQWDKGGRKVAGMWHFSRVVTVW